MQPTITGDRIDLRPFSIEDAPIVHSLAGAREVAATTLSIPHPYEDGLAEEWIQTHAPAFAAGIQANFAVIERLGQQLTGSIGLTIDEEHARAELGYWIGVPYWNRGFATEAAALIVRFGFEELGLHRIYAHHFTTNPASGRVMQRLGMRYEGRLRQHIQKWEKFEDLDVYGILTDEWRTGT